MFIYSNKNLENSLKDKNIFVTNFVARDCMLNIILEYLNIMMK